MRRGPLKALLLTGVAGLLICSSAYGLQILIGKTVVSATAEIAPRALPAKGNAPVTISNITRIHETDGSPPPTLSEMTFMFDKHGSVDTKGLPVCTTAKLTEATPAEARKRCAKAIVGEGIGKAIVTLPGTAPQQISSPLTLFNAPPQNGRPSLIVHAYETVPAPKALLVPLTIERIQHGRYGFQVKIQVPPIADGHGAATLAEAQVGKTWKRGGRTVGFLSAHCNGGRLQVHGALEFADGSFFPGTLTSPCHVAG
ncbi:MAG TPA: hypothetical protein VHA54_08015 [Solirubrobacterales bacterium]|nr:hypothetical protein [Solirubrobacterales bacterium]